MNGFVAAAVTGTTLGAFVALASTSGQGVTYQQFVVNETSFAGEGLEASIGRVMQYSSMMWTRTGASALYSYYAGTNNGPNGCGPANPNHIHGVTGCVPNDTPFCGTLAWYTPASICAWYGGQGYEISLFMGSGVYRILPTTFTANGGPGTLSDGGTNTAQSVYNVGGILQHELGHHVHFPHIAIPGSNPEANPTDEANSCIMNPTFGSFTSTSKYDNPCLREIEETAGAKSHPRDVLKLSTSTQFPVPAASSFSAGTQVASYYGTGFGAVIRGTVATSTDRDSFFFVDNTTATHEVRTCDYASGSSTCTISNASLSLFSKPPGVAYDYTRKKWWFIGVDWHDNYSLDVVSSFDRVTFTDWGYLASGGGLKVQTRNPPAAAYDPLTDRIIVIYTRSDGAVVPPCTSGFLFDGGAADPGCVHDINAVSFAAGSTGTLSTGPRISFLPTPNTFGYGGHGSPAIACDSSVWTVGNCVVMVTGRDVNRSVFSWSFDIYSSGSLRSFTTALGVNGGLTDMAPSIAVNDPRVAGAFVAVVRGTDGLVYVSSKSNMLAAWSAWTSVPGIATSMNPIIASRVGGSNWHLVYAP